MAKKLTFRSGNTTLKMSNEIQDMAENLVNKLLPDTRKIIEAELEVIEADAKKRWLVRKENSQGSREKIYSEVIITPNFELLGVIGNSAEYAWAIKVGKDTQKTQLSQKKRLAQGLLVTPMRKRTNKFANTLAREIGRKLGE